jgi:hypothetical protein
LSCQASDRCFKPSSNISAYSSKNKKIYRQTVGKYFTLYLFSKPKVIQQTLNTYYVIKPFYQNPSEKFRYFKYKSNYVEAKNSAAQVRNNYPKAKNILALANINVALE